VADIIDSTRLAKEVSLEDLPKITGPWATQCKGIIERHGGRINQLLGDGFFACWHDGHDAAPAVSKALQELQQFQQQASPPFRMVLHYGGVALGGVALGEEERISGPEVHFVFRLEKLAGSLAEVRLLSQAAAQKLTALVEVREVGLHSLPGFETKVPVYAF
jgi:class 3 adenylate cyclase